MGIVTLDRTDKKNALTQKAWKELAKLFKKLGSEISCRSIVIRGADNHFCAGADISEFDSVRNTPKSAEA